MRDAIVDIRARGAELVVVGNGQPFHARAFRDEQQLDFPLYVDPDLVAYAAAGLRRGVSTTTNLKTLRAAFGALRKGHRQHRTQGDPWQQGGVFVIRPPQRVGFSHISQFAGDHPPVDRVLAALDS